MQNIPKARTYRLKLQGDSLQEAREIEFEARTADTALRMAHNFCGVRPVQFFEDGRKLADLQLSGRTGFWIVGSPLPLRDAG